MLAIMLSVSQFTGALSPPFYSRGGQGCTLSPLLVGDGAGSLCQVFLLRSLTHCPVWVVLSQALYYLWP